MESAAARTRRQLDQIRAEIDVVDSIHPGFRDGYSLSAEDAARLPEPRLHNGEHVLGGSDVKRYADQRASSEHYTDRAGADGGGDQFGTCPVCRRAQRLVSGRIDRHPSPAGIVLGITVCPGSGRSPR
jgi:hypothetical protein